MLGYAQRRPVGPGEGVAGGPSAAHNAPTILITRVGMLPGLHDRWSAAMATVSALVSGLDLALRRLGYKDSTLVWYRGCWRSLERFFAARGVEEFSRDLALAWVDETCGFFDKEQAGTLKPTDVYLFRVAQMLGDYAGPRGGPTPLLPQHRQAGRGRGRHRRPIPGVAADRRPGCVYRADVHDGGRGVRCVLGHPRRDGSL